MPQSKPPKSPATAKPPKEIQLALQGGGAKIYALVAAITAVKEAVEAGHVRVSRIAGTSAGAIVACLYAAGVAPSTMRTAFADLDPKSVLPTPPSGRGRLAWIRRRWRAARSLWRLQVRRKPLGNPQPIRELIEKLLEQTLSPNNTPATMGNLKPPVLVLASSMAQRLPIIYSTSDTPTKPIVDAVMDSCAIPFIFRTSGDPTQGDLILDGGLGESLPAGQLQRPGADGDILSVSFARPSSLPTPGSPEDLAMAMLDTAINAAVQRQKDKEGTSGVVVELPTYGVDTFDFDRAQEILRAKSHPAWDVAYVKTKTAIDAMLLEIDRTSAHVITQTSWDEASIGSLEQQYRIYKAQQEHHPYTTLEQIFLVEARSLQRKAEPDRIVYSSRFRPGDEELQAVMFTLNTDAGGLPGLGACTAVDSKGRPVPFELVPAVRPADSPVPQPAEPNLRSFAVIFQFTPPLPAGSGECTARMEYRVGEGFPQLLEGKEDMLRAATGKRVIEPVGRIKLLLLAPKVFGELRWAGFEGAAYVPAKCLIPDGSILVPEGFEFYGWEAVDAPPGGILGIRLWRKPT